MKNILLLLFILSMCGRVFSQTVTTRENCYLITDKTELQHTLNLEISEASIGIIPKGEKLLVLGIDSNQYKFIRVKYGDKTGWIHRNMIVDRSLLTENNPEVRSKYINKIKKHRVSQGMNDEELELSVGIQKAKIIKEDNNRLIIGVDAGYTTKNFLNMDISISKGFWYYGFSAQINIKSGIKGRSYNKTLSFGNHLDGIANTGEYYDSYGFDLGYYFIRNLCVGGGIGYAPRTEYKNSYDSSKILNSDGWYNTSHSSGGKMDAKAFINYYFYKGLLGELHIRGQYSIIAGVGASIGFGFNFEL